MKSISSEILPTSNATHVNLYYSEDVEDAIDLNKLFPEMQQLTVDGARYLSFLNQRFEHLTHFASLTPVRDIENFQSFMELNPHLKNLKVQIDWNQQYLHKVSAALPNLQQLDVEFMYPNSMFEPVTETVYFKNIQNLSLTLSGVYDELSDIARNTLDSLVFDKLLTFNMDTNMVFSKDFLIDLICRNQDLHTVAIGHFELSYQQLVRLVESLPKLEKVTLVCLTSKEIHNIHRLLTEMRSTIKMVSVWTDSRGLQMLLNVSDSFEQWRMSHENVGEWERLVTFERD